MRVVCLASTFYHEKSEETFFRARQRTVESGADVCVVAGDYASFLHGEKPPLVNSVEAIYEIADRMQVIYVPGNIDYYSAKGEPIDEILFQGRKAARRHGNIHLLSENSVIISGTKFIGSTLWPLVEGENIVQANKINDFRATWSSTGRMTPEVRNNRHHRSVAFISAELRKDADLTKFVVTHFYPFKEYVEPEYQGSAANALYRSDLIHLSLDEHAPEFWMHGTCEKTGTINHGATTYISNGGGHAGAVNPYFEPTYFIDVKPRPAISAANSPR